MMIEIRTQSQRQAMDWCLVLISQDIGSTVVQSPEDGRWGLLVEEQDQARAEATIRLYRRENQAWFWRRRVVHAGVVFHWGGIIWWLLLGVVFIADLRSNSAFTTAGIMDGELVRQGQWWRLFTATTLHADMAHLAMNCCMALVFGGLAMARFGVAGSLWAGYLAGVVGNLAGLYLSDGPHRSLGASGIVMGTLGLVAIHSCYLLRHSLKASRHVLTTFMAGAMLFVLFGLDPKTDVVAHAGGFVGGVGLGAVLAFVPQSWRDSGRFNGVAVVLWLGWILLTWGVALQPSPGGP